MTRSVSTLYDDDFYAWTQEQAAAVRRLSHEAADGLDIENVALEIEDMGKRDLREVEAYLARLLEHLLKIVAQPQAPSRQHWEAEAVHFQASARRAFSPSMRRLLNSEAIWDEARRTTLRLFKVMQIDVGVPNESLFTADELLSDALDFDEALSRLANRMDRQE